MKLFLGLASLLLSFGVAANNCDGPYAGQKLTRDQVIDKILAQEHNFCGALLDGVDLSQLHLTQTDFSYASMSYSLLNGTDFSKANLTGARLSHSQMDRTYFRWANLQQADLSNSQLNQAQFQQANLQEVNLSRSTIVESNFSQANLKQANLSLITGNSNQFNFSQLQQADVRLSHLTNTQWKNADATGANFSEAILKANDFSDANLSQALLKDTHLLESRLIQTNLTDANFTHANLLQVEFRPSLEGHPMLQPFATVRNLRTIQAGETQADMSELRSLALAYHDIGFHSMDKQITSMIRTKTMYAHLETGGFRWFAGAFQYVFFYLTCDFGNAPSRPLLIFLALLALMVLPYQWSLGSRSTYAGILVSWHSRRDPLFILEASYQHIVQIHQQDPWIEKMIKHYRKALTATYFSLLSSVRIGWQDFNLAQMFTLIQTREYELKPKGWVRSLSGIQSVVSAYLIILWAMAYFGHPFHW